MSVPIPAVAAAAALEQELDRLFSPSSEGRRSLAQPLQALRAALQDAAADPEAIAALGLALDTFEDVLEARLRAAGWPRATVGRGQTG